jgi:hypothetical protein
MVGAGGIYVKSFSVEAIPPGVVMLTLPVAPPEDTTAVIIVEETLTKLVAGTPPNVTAVAFAKLLPVKVIVVPANAEVGVNEVIIGEATYVNPVFVATPAGLVILILPVDPVSITAFISTSETIV